MRIRITQSQQSKLFRVEIGHEWTILDRESIAAAIDSVISGEFSHSKRLVWWKRLIGRVAPAKDKLLSIKDELVNDLYHVQVDTECPFYPLCRKGDYNEMPFMSINDHITFKTKAAAKAFIKEMYGKKGLEAAEREVEDTWEGVK